MTIDRDQAKRILGIPDDFDSETLNRHYDNKLSEINARIEAAPTDALKAKYQQLVKNLEAAKQVLTEQSASPVASLSNTMLADLPGAAPSFTAVDGAMAGEGLTLAEGTLLANRYEIIERIGIGGMGAVFRAQDKTRGEQVALKVMLPGLMKNEKAQQRFLNEARISSNLSHPNIVNVFDVQTEGELTFLSMELLEGQDLRSYLTSLNGRPVSVSDTLEIVKPIAEALTYAHNYTVHRDIKPENIWMTDNGDYKLMDFGIARVQSTSQMTKTGATLGTAYYMAPEQLKAVAKIDGRADQYSLAVMMYEMLSGNIPTGRIKSLKTIDKKIPKKLSNAIDKALEPDPEDRFSSMPDFIHGIAGNSNTVSLSTVALPKWLPAVSAAIVIGIGLFAFGDQLKEAVFPDPQIEKDAIRLEFEVNELEDLLEQQKKVLDNKVRDAENDVRRIESSLRSARSNEDKRKLERDLSRSKGELNYALQAQELAQEVIFDRRSITALQGDQGLASSQLKNKSFRDSRQSFLSVKQRYEEKLSQAESSDDVLYARADANNVLSRWQSTTQARYNNSSDGKGSLERIAGVKSAAEKALNDGDFAKATADYRKLAATLNEEIVWVTAWLSNDEKLFARYLQSYPSGVYSKAVLARLEEYEWQLAKSKNDGAAFARYKQQYPNGKYITQAEDSTWRWAQSTNTESAFAAYAKTWPNGKYSAQVETEKEKAAYLYATNARSIQALQAYQRNYPNSPRLNEVARAEDKLAFSIASRTNTVESYRNYLSAYPNGQYRQQAQSGQSGAANNVESSLYSKAQSSGQENDYRTYIKRYPNGKYTQQALEKIAYVKFWDQQYSASPANTISGLQTTPSGNIIGGGWTAASPDSTRSQGLFLSSNNSGQLINQSTFGGIGPDKVNQVATFSNGDVILVGTQKQSSMGQLRLWAARLSIDGKVIWQNHYNGTGSSEAQSVIVNGANEALIVGSTYSQANSFDAWALKLDANGKLLWEKTYGTTGRDYATSVIDSGDGGYILAGSTTGQSTSLKNSKSRILKIDGNGRLLWEKVFKSDGRNATTQILNAGANNYLAVGWKYASSKSKTPNLFLLEIDSSGSQVWSRDFFSFQSGSAAKLRNGFAIAALNRNGASSSLLLINSKGQLSATKNLPYGLKSARAISSTNSDSVLIAGDTKTSSSIQRAWLAKYKPPTLEDVLANRY